MTVGEAIDHGYRLLRRAKIESARIDSYILLEKITGRPRTSLMAHSEDELKPKVAHEYIALVNRRAQHVPLVHLTNTREFYGIDLFIDEHVLTPRIETEKMVDFAIKYAPENGRLVDIGTGSGAIAIAIKSHRPDLEVWGTDVTDEALIVAEKNIKQLNLDIKLVKSDLFSTITEEFDVICTNLPYLKDSADLMPEVQKEPAVALFGGKDGLDLYRRFLKQLPDYLRPGGYLFTECDPWQQTDLKAEAATIGLQPIEEDYFILGFQLK